MNVIDLTVPAAANRWPVFAAAVANSAAFRSVHALPLRLRGEAIGALNLFHHQPGPLPPVDLSLGQALADVATIGILSERAVRHGEILNEQLQTATPRRPRRRSAAPCGATTPARHPSSACHPRTPGCPVGTRP